MAVGPLEAKMRRWLDSPDPAERFHAATRIARGFAPEPDPPLAPEPDPPPRLPPHLEALLAPEPWEDLDWLRRWALAGPDPAADVRAYAVAPEHIADMRKTIHGWLHVAVMGDAWASILRELLSILWRSGLAGASASVNLCVVYEPGREGEDLSWLPPWAKVVQTGGPFEQGENSTLEVVRRWAVAAPRSRIWYGHTKGASHAGRPDYTNVVAWRDYLAYFNLLEWRDCVKALDGYEACGVDYTPDRVTPEWERVWGPHLPRGRAFAGNFFWVRSDFLAALPPGVPEGADRWWAEWDFLSRGDPVAMCFHDAQTNHYTTAYPRARYEPAARRAAKPRVALGVKPPKG